MFRMSKSGCFVCNSDESGDHLELSGNKSQSILPTTDPDNKTQPDSAFNQFVTVNSPVLVKKCSDFVGDIQVKSHLSRSEQNKLTNSSINHDTCSNSTKGSACKYEPTAPENCSLPERSNHDRSLQIRRSSPPIISDYSITPLTSFIDNISLLADELISVLTEDQSEHFDTDSTGPTNLSSYDSKLSTKHGQREDGLENMSCVSESVMDSQKGVLHETEHSIDTLENSIIEDVTPCSTGGGCGSESDSFQVVNEGTKENVMETRKLTLSVMKQAWTDDDKSAQSHVIEPCSCHADTERPAPFFTLPVEIQHKIFSYLTIPQLCHKVALVCQSWRELASDPIHWQILDLGTDNTSLEFDTRYSIFDIIQLINRAPLLKSLSLTGQMNLGSLVMQHVVNSCPQLQTLNLGFCTDVTETILFMIATKCIQLSDLNVEGCHAVSDKFLEKVTVLKKLQCLNLSHCRHITDEGLVFAASHLPCLTEINIDGVASITDSAIDNLIEACGSRLTCLKLDGAELTDASIEALGRCQNLDTLHISFCELLTDSSLLFLEKCSSLRNLKLRKGCNLSTAILEKFFEGKALSELRYLDLSECTQLHDLGVMALARCCGGSLLQLDLSWCWHVTDSGIKAIVDNCRRLTHLSLVGMDQITGECFELIPENIPNLVSLDLRQCNQVMDDLMKCIVRRKPDLHVLNYYGMDMMETEG